MIFANSEIGQQSACDISLLNDKVLIDVQHSNADKTKGKLFKLRMVLYFHKNLTTIVPCDGIPNVLNGIIV